jgi:hypothetical protein
VAWADSRSLATSLASTLRNECNDQLSEIAWFRADWQRGGAATGHAVFTEADGETPVVVKFPVGQRELRWTRRLGVGDHADPVAPRLFASGTAIGGYDLGWIVMERLPYGPLGQRWHARHIERIAEAIANFHHATSTFEIHGHPRYEDWDDLLARSNRSVKVNRPDHRSRWSRALKAFAQRVDAFVDAWRARPVTDWLHGDVHIANAMSREAVDHGPVCLVDLAEVHPGHWVEDGIYLERQLWARPSRMKTFKPVKALAEARKALGLPIDDGYAELAMIRRGLYAATAPAFMKTEGNPRHLEACLDRLEFAMADVKR